jgi:hypothetical protein
VFDSEDYVKQQTSVGGRHECQCMMNDLPDNSPNFPGRVFRHPYRGAVGFWLVPRGSLSVTPRYDPAPCRALFSKKVTRLLIDLKSFVDPTWNQPNLNYASPCVRRRHEARPAGRRIIARGDRMGTPGIAFRSQRTPAGAPETPPAHSTFIPDLRKNCSYSS